MKHATPDTKPPFPRAADDSSLNPTVTQLRLTRLMLGVAENLQDIARKAQLQTSTKAAS